jgi:hypothetical protein
MVPARSAQILGVLALSACGRLGFDAVDGARGGDAREGDAASIDALEPCTTFGPWQTPVPFPDVNTATFTEWAPTLSADQLTLMFASNRGGDYDLYMATRASATDAFALPVGQAALNTTAEDSDPALTPDARTVYFTNTTLGASHLYRSKRSTSTSSDWSAPVLVPETASGVIFGPGVSADGTELFYEDQSRITRATVSGDQITVVGPVVELGLDVGFVTLTADGLTMYFEQYFGPGSTDILVATRPAIGQPFATPVPFTELQTAGLEDDPDISRDGTRFVFASDRGGAGEDIYEMTRSCL